MWARYGPPRVPSSELKQWGHRPRRVAPPAGRSAWPLPRRRRSVVAPRLVASGSGLLAQRCLVGIEPPLELAPFGLRPDLDEEHHDDTGPQCPAERVEQVGHQQQRLRRRRGFEQELANMNGQANYEADTEDP